jgi:hypothetical protein
MSDSRYATGFTQVLFIARRRLSHLITGTSDDITGFMC